MSDIYVTLSTSVLNITSVPQVVLLSTLNSPGTIFTIRDTTGSASMANPITLSTTLGNLFYDGLSSYKITQPYGYLSVNPKTSSIWSLQNSFAFPDQQAAAIVQSLTAANITTSSFTATTTTVSSFAGNSITVSSISSLQSATVFGNLTVNSNVLIGNLLQVQNISVIGNLLTTGSFSSISSVAIGGDLHVQGSSIFNREVIINGSTNLNGNLTLRGNLIANAEATFQSTVTCLGTFNCIGPANFLSSTTFTQPITFQSNVTVNGNISTTSNLVVGQTLTTSSLTVTGQTTLNTLTILQGATIQAGTISTVGTMTIGSNLIVSQNLSTNGVTVLSTAQIQNNLYVVSSLGVNCNAPSYTLDVNGILNATTIYKNGQPLESYTTFSTLTLSNLYVDNSVTINSAFLGGVSTTVQSSWSSLESSRLWQGIACSANGQIVVATPFSSQIRVSNTFGISWLAVDSVAAWKDVTCSFTGQYMLTFKDNSNLYVSSNYGSNWVARDSSRSWANVAISSNGRYQTATVPFTGIYISSDYGSNWTLSGAPNRQWTSVSMSYSGQIQAATSISPTFQKVYMSFDYGSTWNSNATQTASWSAVAVSGNGQYVTGVANTGFIFTSSDSGSNFTQRDSSRNWNSVALSYSGQFQAATNSNGRVYYSSDFGSNWTAFDTNRVWSKICMSSNGHVLYGSVGTTITSGNLYASYTPFQIIPATSNVEMFANLAVSGTLSKGAGSFEIQHPLNPEKRLVHSFIEGPRCDLLYRGKAILSNGTAIVDLEKESTANGSQMTPGTFDALATHSQVYLQNNNSFDMVRGTINKNLLTITCENSNSSVAVDWMVIAERHDPFIKTWNRTDENGFLILEHSI